MPSKMATILHTAFSSPFSWMTFFFVFWFKFQSSSFLRCKSWYANIGWYYGVAPDWRQAIIRTNDGPVYLHIKANNDKSI